MAGGYNSEGGHRKGRSVVVSPVPLAKARESDMQTFGGWASLCYPNSGKCNLPCHLAGT